MRTATHILTALGIALLTALALEIIRYPYLVFLIPQALHRPEKAVTLGAFTLTLLSGGVFLVWRIRAGAGYRQLLPILLLIAIMLYLAVLKLRILHIVPVVRTWPSFSQNAFAALCILLVLISAYICRHISGRYVKKAIDYIAPPGMLAAGFLLGIAVTMQLAHCADDDFAARNTTTRLLDYNSYSEFSGTPNGVVSFEAFGQARNHILSFFRFFLFDDPVLPVLALLLLLSVIGHISFRSIVHALFWAGIGALMCMVCGFRYYSENYWILIDLFFLAAAVLVVTGFGERWNFRRTILYLSLSLILTVFQHIQVHKSYPGVSDRYRYQLDKAWAGIYDNPDLLRLMRTRYGDNASFMSRVLLDDRLNGTDRGIDLLNAPPIKRLIAENPRVQTMLARRKID